MASILISANGIVTIIILIVASISSYMLRRTYRKYNAMRNTMRIKTQDIARQILDENGLSLITIECAPNMGKKAVFDPDRNLLLMGLNIYSCDSIAAIAITVREVGRIIRYFNDGRSFDIIKLFNWLSKTLYSAWVFILYIVVRLQVMPSAVMFIYQFGFLLLLIAFIIRAATIPFIVNEANTGHKELENRGIIYGIELFHVERVLVREIFRGLTFF